MHLTLLFWTHIFQVFYFIYSNLIMINFTYLLNPFEQMMSQFLVDTMKYFFYETENFFDSMCVTFSIQFFENILFIFIPGEYIIAYHFVMELYDIFFQLDRFRF